MTAPAYAPYPPLGVDTLERLRQISTPTLCTQLFKLGFRNMYLHGVRPLCPDKRMAGEAVTVRFAPTLTLLVSFPPRAGASVPYSGSGWPANSNYTLLFDGNAIGGGTTSAAGTLMLPTGGNPSFTVPPNTPPGTHTVTVTSGTSSASASLTTQ